MTRARELSKLLNASSFSVDSDFNVGINSTSPDVKLDVGGAVLVTGISTFENTTQSTSSTTGALIVSGGVGIAKSLNVGGNLSVAGTITYDDVTNVDSVGIVTARGGFEIGEAGVGGTITATGQAQFVGVVTASSFVGDGTGLTGVASTDNIITGTAATFTNNVNISGITTVGVLTAYAGVNVTGIVTATSYRGDGSSLTGVGGDTDITSSLFI